MRAEQQALATDTDLEFEDEDDTQDVAVPAQEPRRPSMFKMPNIREDLRLLPSILLSRRLLLLPLVLLLVGLGIYLVFPTLSPDIQSIAGLYIQFFFIPPALFTFFVAGFFAPRASYMVGFLYGVLAGAIWSAAIIFGPAQALQDPTQPTTVVLDPLTVVGTYLVIGAIYGTLAAALAAWYRDFLRGMQERGRARRAEREALDRAKRRDERQEARRVAKQRPTT